MPTTPTTRLSLIRENVAALLSQEPAAQAWLGITEPDPGAAAALAAQLIAIEEAVDEDGNPTVLEGSHFVVHVEGGEATTLGDNLTLRSYLIDIEVALLVDLAAESADDDHLALGEAEAIADAISAWRTSSACIFDLEDAAEFIASGRADPDEYDAGLLAGNILLTASTYDA